MARILFFGRLGDEFGREVDVDLPAGGCTVGELRALLAERLPSPTDSLRQRRVNVCVDQEIVRDSAFVRPGQEIAFMPPLSGG
jgi:molybdopterin converting factor subunit 1